MEALNQILELLSTETNKENEHGEVCDMKTSTTLLSSVHIQFLAGCFGLGVKHLDAQSDIMIHHYQVSARSGQVWGYTPE